MSATLDRIVAAAGFGRPGGGGAVGAARGDRDRLRDLVEAGLDHATGGPLLALLAFGLTILVGVAASVRAPEPIPIAVMTVGTSVGLWLGLVVPRGRLAVVATLATVALLTTYAKVVFDLAPTVVWLYAFVVPAVGITRGWREGAVAGLVSAPAIHWIETGIPVDPLDPQTPYALLILVALGVVPGELLRVARARRIELDAQLGRTAALLEETQRAHEAERVARAGEREAHRAAILMLACAAEMRDGTTGAHVEAVRDLATRLAAVAGLEPWRIEEIGWAATLHDVGKLRVPDRVLLKPGRLTDEEWAIIRQHPRWGEELLRGFAGFEVARQIARWHHENWDGSGYPDGLKGTQIPEPARIVRVVDVFDALRSERPYKAAWPLERIEAELRRMRGRALDPELADLFLERILRTLA